VPKRADDQGTGSVRGVTAQPVCGAAPFGNAFFAFLLKSAGFFSHE